MEGFIPVIGPAIVGGVAYLGIVMNNSRADRRDDKSWYRKLLLENSVAYLNKLDDALAAIASSHENKEDLERSLSEKHWDVIDIQILRDSMGELKSAGLLLKMSCSPKTSALVDEVNQKFQDVLVALAESRKLSHHATEAGTPGFDDHVVASDRYIELGDELEKLKPGVMSVFKADIAGGGFPVAEKQSERFKRLGSFVGKKRQFGRSKQLGSSANVRQITSG